MVLTSPYRSTSVRRLSAYDVSSCWRLFSYGGLVSVEVVLESLLLVFLVYSRWGNSLDHFSRPRLSSKLAEKNILCSALEEMYWFSKKIGLMFTFTRLQVTELSERPVCCSSLQTTISLPAQWNKILTGHYDPCVFNRAKPMRQSS
ncbi:hypothetical protein BaRGS_00025540 [Batillaria attramentaria]|uniref:Uncharacterized protein n=1 Tax=Batillaria attramentaria TaxID=370345 RepID=A0ABD0K843_9CAEN